MEEIKITGQVGGKVNDEDLEIRFKTLLRQMRDARGLNTFSDQLKAIMDEVDKSTLASELSYGSQLTELNQLTARVSEIFVGLAKQNETDRIFRERQYEEVLEKKDLEITNLKEQLEEIKGKLELREKDYLEIEEGHKKKEEELVNVKGRVEDQAKMVQFQDDQLKVKDQTIANQAQKIDSMSLEVSQNEELKLSITNLQEEINHLNEKHTKDKQQSEFDFERQLFSKERELQQSFQERIEKIQDDMNDKYEARLSSIIDKHENRIAVLNQELSSIKAENQQRERREQELLKEIDQLKKLSEGKKQS